MVITTAQLHSTKPELRFCASSNPVSEIRDGEDLWQWSRLEIRLNAFRRSTILQKQFIIIIIIVFYYISIVIFWGGVLGGRGGVGGWLVIAYFYNHLPKRMHATISMSSSVIMKILFIYILGECKIPSHLSEENQLSLKKSHTWRMWATPQNFCLAFIDELEKQLFIKKNCWSEPIKN